MVSINRWLESCQIQLTSTYLGRLFYLKFTASDVLSYIQIFNLNVHFMQLCIPNIRANVDCGIAIIFVVWCYAPIQCVHEDIQSISSWWRNSNIHNLTKALVVYRIFGIWRIAKKHEACENLVVIKVSNTSNLVDRGFLMAT